MMPWLLAFLHPGEEDIDRFFAPNETPVHRIETHDNVPDE